MKNPMRKEPTHSRLGTIGHSVSDHTTEAGHKVREEFDDVAPKVAAAASKAAHTVADDVAPKVAAAASKAARTVTDDVAPKVAAAASKAAHTAVERSRPARAEAASRSSAALSGLLGAVTPEQIERVSRRDAKRASRKRGRIALLLAAAGGAVAWALWWKRSEPDLDPWETEEVKEPTEAVLDPEDHGKPETS
jgi:ferric-dicitrate binding protein FerR (iron transport regulator)